MITFLQGPSHRANTAAIFAALQEKVEAGQRAILLVPEHLSHEMERQLCVLCGNSACRWAEVLTFPNWPIGYSAPWVMQNYPPLIRAAGFF